LVCSPWNTLPLSSLLYFPAGTNPGLPRDVCEADKTRWETAMAGKKHKFQSENVMGGLYLGIAITGVNALIAMGLVIAFM
jgi:hypothetical protein